MATVSSQTAATRLGVSDRQVRRLVAAGELEGRPLGRALLIDTSSVNRMASVSVSRRGRPWDEASAWAALWLLSGQRNIDWVDGHTRSRLRSRLRDMDAQELAVRARRRANTTRWRANEEALTRLADYLVLTGRSALTEDAVAARFDLAAGAAAGTLEGYMLQHDVESLASSFVLVPDPSGPATLRAVSDERWLIGKTAPLAAVALDLMDAPGTRQRSAGAHVLHELLAGV